MTHPAGPEPQRPATGSVTATQPWARRGWPWIIVGTILITGAVIPERLPLHVENDLRDTLEVTANHQPWLTVPPGQRLDLEVSRWATTEVHWRLLGKPRTETGDRVYPARVGLRTEFTWLIR
jgi:hypothetical protein